ARCRFVHLLGLMAVQVLALGLFGWGWTVQTVGGAYAAVPGEPAWLPERLPFGAELVLVAPFLVGLVLSWAAFYPAEQALAGPGDPRHGERPFGGRWGYVAFLTRQYLAVVGVP